MIRNPIKRNDWLRLPSGSVVAVCRIEGPEDALQVSLRYLSDDGVMATGDFLMRLDFLMEKAEKVEVATCPI